MCKVARSSPILFPDGVAVGYFQNFNFNREPIIYHSFLGEQPQLLSNALLNLGITPEGLLGTAYKISNDGNYIGGFGDGWTFQANGWAVYFDDQLLFDSGCEISGPENQTFDLVFGDTGVVYDYETTFSCDSEQKGLTLTQTAGLPSGSNFPVGTTTQIFEIRNADGELLDGFHFTVTVNDTYCGTNILYIVEPLSRVVIANIDQTSSAEITTTVPANEYFLETPLVLNAGESYEIAVE